jgi:purine catabolism regulator
MSLPLRKMLAMPAFKEFTVLAGKKGLTRIVTSVSVMDAPDISDWLKGGEILMTTGYIMKDDLSQFINLIISINHANAAALFIKMKRFIDDLPREIYDIAEKLNFPIISMPLKYAFTDVINPVLSILVNEQARKLKISEDIHHSFTNLILKGGDTYHIIKTLAKIINSNVAYLDAKFGHNYISSVSGPFFQDISHLNLKNLSLKYKIYPVKIDFKIYGYLVYSNISLGNIPNEYSRIAIKHASTALKLEIQKKISNLEIENRHKNEFVQDIILNNIKYPEEIKNRAKLYGWSYENGLSAVFVIIDDFKEKNSKVSHKKEIASLEMMRESIFDVCKKIMQNNFNNVLFTNLSDSITLLVEPQTLKLDNFRYKLTSAADAMRKTVHDKYEFTLTIGIGEYRHSIKDVYLSYQEAQNAAKIGKTLYKRNRTVFYCDLGVYRLLNTICNTPEATDFCNASIGLLKEHDQKYGSDLYQTLICIKKCDWNLKIAAAKLYLHYNTVKYRFKKIQEIMDVNLEDSEARFVVSMSIKLLQMTE